MSENSYWIISVADNQSSEPILDFIIEQGEVLKKETNNKIRGVLTKAGASWNTVIETMSKLTLTALYQPTHHKGLKDAANLYTKSTYEFLIVDEIHKYELSVFQITCNDTLPIKLNIDPLIAKEEELDESIDVTSLEAFKSLFRKIVTSDKVVYIIDRLLKLPDPEPIANNDNEEETDNKEH